jgi:hypothetical protein
VKKQPRRTLLAAAGLFAVLGAAPAAAFPQFDLNLEVMEDPVPAYEYYNAEKDAYFVTTLQAEIDALQSARFASWKRMGNGEAFLAFNDPVRVRGVEADKAGSHPVCRFFIPPASHFLSASEDECAAVALSHPEFVLETNAAFYAWLPDAAGNCPRLATAIGGFEFQPVYRLWNNRVETNHRLTTSKAARSAMVDEGWVSEGYGDDGVAMCVPHWD